MTKIRSKPIGRVVGGDVPIKAPRPVRVSSAFANGRKLMSTFDPLAFFSQSSRSKRPAQRIYRMTRFFPSRQRNCQPAWAAILLLALFVAAPTEVWGGCSHLVTSRTERVNHRSLFDAFIVDDSGGTLGRSGAPAAPQLPERARERGARVSLPHRLSRLGRVTDGSTHGTGTRSSQAQ
jgi:hypothetical protein